MRPSLSEILKALYGVFLFARLHPSAPSLFNRSVDGFWKSLFAAVLVLPPHILMTKRIVDEKPEHVPYEFGDVITDLLIYVIIWLAYPVLMVAVTKVLGRRDRFLDYIVPYNWAMVPVGYLLGAITCLGMFGVVTRNTEINFFIIAYAVVALFLAELGRRQLQIGPFLAFAIVMLDITFNVAVMNLLETFAQQPGAPL
jgi:hypothetical protein